MGEDNTRPSVTKRDLYSSLAPVFILVGILALTVARSEDETLRWISTMLIAVGAIVCGFLYSIFALREKGKERAARNQ